MSRLLTWEMSSLANQKAHPRRMQPKSSQSLHYVFGVMLFMACCTQIWVRVRITSKGYELEEWRARVNRSYEELAQARLEYAQLIQPQQLTKTAQAKLAMVSITRDSIRRGIAR